jgi:Peptidase A4 family
VDRESTRPFRHSRRALLKTAGAAVGVAVASPLTTSFAQDRFPFPLVPTNMRNVYAIPAPPDDFDPDTASAVELIRNGILWKRPQPGDPPGFIANWKRMTSRRWRSADRLIPHLSTLRRRPQSCNQPASQVVTNSAWCGGIIADTGQQWNTVMASWNVPTVSVPNEPQGTGGVGGAGDGWKSSAWVGIDGALFQSSDPNQVVQAGTTQDVSSAGQPSYGAFFEWYVPGPYLQNELNEFPYINPVGFDGFNVSANDSISVSVQYILFGSGAALISIGNETNGQHTQVVVFPPPGALLDGHSIEWILEAGDDGLPPAGLGSIPAFTPLNFTGAYGCSGGSNLFPPGGNTIVGDPENGVASYLVNGNTNQTLATAALGPGCVTITFTG